MTVTENFYDLVPNGTPRDRFWDVIHWIEGNQWRWRQATWETPDVRNDCGSAYCAFGWVVVRAGYATLSRTAPGFVLASDLPDDLRAGIGAGHFMTIGEEQTEIVHVSGIAMALLGVDSTLANLLSFGNNGLDDLRRYAEQYFGPDPRAT